MKKLQIKKYTLPQVLSIPHLVALPVAVDHPVFSIGADLQLEGIDKVGLVRFLGDGPLGGNSCQNLQEVQVHLEERGEKNRMTKGTGARSMKDEEAVRYAMGVKD